MAEPRTETSLTDDAPPARPVWAPVLSDGIVRLRPHALSDVDAVLAQCSDPGMQRWTNVPAPYRREDAEAFIAGRRNGWESGTSYSFAIECDGRFCGSVALRPDGAGAAEVGYGLGPWARGRGVMSRALRLALGWSWEAVDLQAVHWRAVVGNWPSRRVAWATGFSMEGTVRDLLPARVRPDGVGRDGVGPDGAGRRREDAWVGTLRRGEPMAPPHPWLVPPRLSTPELDAVGAVLRPHREGDVRRIVEACSDPVTQYWLPALPSPYTERDGYAYLASVAESAARAERLHWVVADAAHGHLLGDISLFRLAPGLVRPTEVGYWTHPDARRRGVMTAAVTAAAHHALAPVAEGGLGLPAVQLCAADGNLGSQAVARAAGFRPSGRDHAGERLRDGTALDLLRFEYVPAIA